MYNSSRTATENVSVPISGAEVLQMTMYLAILAVMIWWRHRGPMLLSRNFDRKQQLPSETELCLHVQGYLKLLNDLGSSCCDVAAILYHYRCVASVQSDQGRENAKARVALSGCDAWQSEISSAGVHYSTQLNSEVHSDGLVRQNDTHKLHLCLRVAFNVQNQTESFWIVSFDLRMIVWTIRVKSGPCSYYSIPCAAYDCAGAAEHGVHVYHFLAVREWSAPWVRHVCSTSLSSRHYVETIMLYRQSTRR